MKKICFYVAPVYQKNKIFDIAPSNINQDGEMLAFHQLRERLLASGFSVDTQDIVSAKEADCVVYLEMPPQITTAKEKSYLLAFECEVIRPDNWNESKHKMFRGIFSLCKHECKGTLVHPIPIPQRLKDSLPEQPWEQRKLCTLMSGPYVSFHPTELYSKRADWIRWFTQNSPQDFDFYGSNWSQMKIMGPRWQRAFARIPKWTNIFRPPLSLYRGRAQDKLKTLNAYKFSICFENSSHDEYITEKIFDCFFAHNVPIYMGAPDIQKWIPKECYIDVRDFKSKEEIFQFMKSYSKDQYDQQQDAVKKYLASPAFERFTNERFVKVIGDEILKSFS